MMRLPGDVLGSLLLGVSKTSARSVCLEGESSAEGVILLLILVSVVEMGDTATPAIVDMVTTSP